MNALFDTSSFFFMALLWLFLFMGLLLSMLKSLYWTYRWQLKEYRFDRMRDFLGTHTGRKWIWNVWNVLEIAFLLAAFVASVSFPGNIETTVTGIAVLFLAAETANYLRYRLRPVLTFKAMTIGVGAVVLGAVAIALLGFLIDMGIVRAVLVAIILQPFFVMLLVVLFQPVTMAQRKRVIEQARQKLETMNPVVIGVTGSYGKTTTKEALKTVLSQKFNVLATPKNINVDIGVAQTILNQLEPEHEVLIVEMGAYKMGEIDAICNLVSPIIGVITAIKDQHVSLFGSLEAIKDAKSELIASLPASGMAVLNADSEGALSVHDRTDAKVRFYSITDVAHSYASDIQPATGHIGFDLHVGSEKRRVDLQLAGKQSIPSFLAAALVGERLGMTIDQIAAGVAAAESVEGTMHLRTARHGIQLIDDSYNSNPDGFIAALDYLELFTYSRKIVMTTGMYELGDRSDEEHMRVGERIGEVADMLIITSKDHAAPLIEGALKGGLTESAIIVQPSPQVIIDKQFSEFGNDDVVLAEGRVPSVLIDTLLTNV